MPPVHRILTTFLFTLVVLSSAYSQMTIIPKLGVNLARMDIDDGYWVWPTEMKYRPGLIIGVGLEIPLIGNRVSVQPELQFTQKGYRAFTSVPYYPTGSNLTGGGYDVYRSHRHDYLDFPLIFKVKASYFYFEDHR
jgi:hypothetical protein